MSEKCEEIVNSENLRVNDMTSPLKTDNETPAIKLPRPLRRNSNKSGDWIKDDDVWYLSPQKITDDIGNLEPEKLAEWKYRNVYSMSVPSDSLPAYWSPRRAATDANKKQESVEIFGNATNFLQEMSDTSENESKGGCLIDNLREYLANYQELNGTPRDEYSFVSLMKVMGQATGHSLVALFYIVVNVSPLIQLSLFILRFILDKLISIRNMGYNQQSIVKYAILGGQLVCIYVGLVFIFGFIVMPILHLVLAILAKILLFN